MFWAPCAECPYSCFWFMGQFLPATCGITQFCLRRKALENDLSKYRCFQGQFIVCCCIKADACCEESCPCLCLCIEAHLCNAMAISATRMFVMEKYDLQTDPCDNRLIRFNNCVQYIRCIVDIIAIFYDDARALAQIIDLIADFIYHSVSGCMTAQVAHELNYQATRPPAPPVENAGGFELPSKEGQMNPVAVAVALPVDAATINKVMKH